MKYPKTFLMSLLLIVGLTLSGVAAPAHEQGVAKRKGHSKQMVVKRADAPVRVKLKRSRVVGVVEQVTGQTAVIRTRDGRPVTVYLGPQNYWVEKGYVLNTGVPVTVSGWYDPAIGEERYFASRITGPGIKYKLTTSGGRPYWIAKDVYVVERAPYHDSYIIWYDASPPPRSMIIGK